MRVRLTLNKLNKWIKENTNDKNDCLKDLYFNDKKVIKIKYDNYEDDMYILQLEDGGLSYAEYDYSLGREITDTDFFTEKKRWRAKNDYAYYCVTLSKTDSGFQIVKRWEDYSRVDNNIYLSGNYFQTEEQAQKFIDDLNKATVPLFEKAKNGEYDEKD